MPEDISLKEFFEMELGGFKENTTIKLDKILEQTTKTNGKVAEIEKWRLAVCDPISEIIQERKDQRKIVVGYVWKIIIMILMGLMGFNAYAKIINPSQDDVKKLISDVLKSEYQSETAK